MKHLKIEINHCERDDRVLFQHVETTFSAGNIYQIVGQNGAGKTTLLRIICGLTDHYEGSVFLDDVSCHEHPHTLKNNLLYIGHLAGVKGMLTPVENLRWQAALHADKAQITDQEIECALEKVGLKGYEDVLCCTLSAGQKRRVNLARVFIEVSPIWVFDEPFTAIDKQGVAFIETLMADHAKAGGVVIFTSHQDVNDTLNVHYFNVEEFAPLPTTPSVVVNSEGDNAS